MKALHGSGALIGVYARTLTNRLVRTTAWGRTWRGAVVVVGLVVWWGMFSATRWGVSKLIELTPLAQPVALKGLELLLLLTLSVLTFSGVLITLMHLYLSRDLPLVARLPVSPAALFTSKWIEISVSSGWMPITFGCAVILGVGAGMGAPPAFYGLAVAGLVMLLAIPTGLAMAATSAVVSVLPATRTRDILVFVSLVFLLGAYLAVRSMHPEQWARPGGLEELSSSVALLELPASDLLPSTWLAQALRPLLTGEGGPGWGGLAAVGGAAVASMLIGYLVFAASFRRGLSRTLTSRGPVLEGQSRAVRILFRVTDVLPSAVAAFARKDLLNFGRDSSQWSQLLLLGSVVLVYLLNISAFPLQDLTVLGLSPALLTAAITAVNTTMIGMVLAAVAVRFLFASVSLEGRAVWIPFSSPVATRVLLVAKVAVGLPALLGFGLLMVTGSGVLLHLDAPLMALSALTMVLIAAGLSGLGIGLGALMPNFRAESPARVAASIGGLLFMLLSVAFVAVQSLLMMYPAYLVSDDSGDSIGWSLGVPLLVLAVLIAGVAAWLPVFLGTRALDQWRVTGA